MEILVILSIFIVLMVIGAPMGTALGVAGVASLFTFDLGVAMTGRNFVSGIASFPLLAIPFFILAGMILERARLAAKIAALFELIVGRMTGGLAMAAVITCMFWGAISGSGPATTAAVGLVLLAPMVRHGYDRNFAAATIANASDISIIIPPSIAFIIYGNLTGASVSALFMAGVIPGILVGMGMVAAAWWVSTRRGYRGVDQRGSFREIVRAARDSFWALLSPVIILGGIYSGVFTPTEAAVVAVFYSLFVALVIYRTVRLQDLVGILTEAAVTTSVIMYIVVFAGIFSWTASTMGMIDAAANLINDVSPNTLVTILMFNALLLILGMFLDAISICYLLIPILAPVMMVSGIDPVWYGVVFITALAIGQTTPPIGVNLFTIANLADTSVDAVSREIIPYVVVNVAALVILSLFPWLSLILPKATGLYSP